jgi:hypothetical protein
MSREIWERSVTVDEEGLGWTRGGVRALTSEDLW